MTRVLFQEREGEARVVEIGAKGDGTLERGSCGQSACAGKDGVAETEIRVGDAQFHGAFPGCDPARGVAALEREGAEGGEYFARGGPFRGEFAEGGLGSGKVAVGQTEIRQHGARRERRHGLNSHLRRCSGDGRQGKRTRATRDAGTQVTLDGNERHVIDGIQGALRRHSRGEGGEERGKRRAIGGRLA